MKKTICIYAVCLAISLMACDNKQNSTKQTDSSKDTISLKNEETKENAEAQIADKNSGKLILQFKDFHLGDAEHYVFVSEKGEEIEFGRNEDKSVEFSSELPENEMNSENQGWGANKKLVNQWFEISYQTKKMPLYQDGPEGDVLVITKASPIKK